MNFFESARIHLEVPYRLNQKNWKPHRSIITPHVYEFDHLFGEHNTDEEHIKKAHDVSKVYNITFVLKGHYTMTVRPDSKVYANSSGNPSMAIPGSGDVLDHHIMETIAYRNLDRPTYLGSSL